MRSLICHLSHTVRRLIKSPGSAITAILILGLGIGGNTAIFSLINGVLLRPLPYPRSEQLVQLFQPFSNYDRFTFDYPDYVDYRDAQRSFRQLAVYSADQVNLTGKGGPERINCFYVTSNFFQVFGRSFLVGRPFDTSEDEADASATVVISERFWQKHFRGDRNIVGSELVLNDRSFRVIGVTPEQGNESFRSDVYMPLPWSPDIKSIQANRGGHTLSCVGRLTDGVTLQQARFEFNRINQNLVTKYPSFEKGFGISLIPYLDSVISDYATALWILQVAVGCLLLIACANVANLLLVRTQGRQREIGIRAALGARWFQLVAHILGESLVLAIGGGILGVFLSWNLLNAVKLLTPESAPRFYEVGIDGVALFFALGLILLVALGAGLVPILTSLRGDPVSGLKNEAGRSQTSGPSRQRGQAVLVTGQVALTAVLLVGAGLMSRSFQALQNLPLGFKPDHVLSADIYLTATRYDNAKCRVFFDALTDNIRQLPGVTEVGINDDPPFIGQNVILFGVPGEQYANFTQMPVAETQAVSPGYFRALGLSLLRGRFLDDRDRAESQNVVVINDAIAQRFFHGQEPVGKQIYHLGGKQNVFYTIIGVVANIQHNNPESAQTDFQAYFSFAQSPGNEASLVIRTQADPLSLIGALRKAVADLDSNLPISNVRTLDDIIGESFSTRRLSAVIVDTLSSIALLMAAVGLYAVLSYIVGQRTREIGLRITLGAGYLNILNLVVRKGLLIVGAGLLAGLAAILAIVPFVQSNLYGISAYDPAAILAGIIVLGLTAVAACLAPAVRATRVNPIAALRE
jgi:putative ABC transport system permease protein